MVVRNYEEHERENNESGTGSVEIDVVELKNSLNSLIRDRSLYYHHWYRSYSIFDVKATENKDIYRIAYLDYESFDIIDVRIEEPTRDQYINALHIMKREDIRKKGCVCEKHLTFIERIMKSVRDKVSDIVEYGENWQVNSWFGYDYDGYISIIPATRSSSYNPCVCLKLKGNIERVIGLSNKELSDLIERISEEGLAYAKEMAPNIRRGDPYENKYEDEESLYGYTKIEKHFDF